VVLATTKTAVFRAGNAGAVLAADDVNLTQSEAQMVVSRGEVTMDQSGAKVLLTPGAVTMDQSGAGLLAAREVQAKNSSTLMLLAGKVEGDIEASFGPRESAIFGAVAGVVAGLIVLLGNLVRRRFDFGEG
jgi:hypothetical protein